MVCIGQVLCSERAKSSSGSSFILIVERPSLAPFSQPPPPFFHPLPLVPASFLPRPLPPAIITPPSHSINYAHLCKTRLAVEQALYPEQRRNSTFHSAIAHYSWMKFEFPARALRVVAVGPAIASRRRTVEPCGAMRSDPASVPRRPAVFEQTRVQIPSPLRPRVPPRRSAPSSSLLAGDVLMRRRADGLSR